MGQIKSILESNDKFFYVEETNETLASAISERVFQSNIYVQEMENGRPIIMRSASHCQEGQGGIVSTIKVIENPPTDTAVETGANETGGRRKRKTSKKRNKKRSGRKTSKKRGGKKTTKKRSKRTCKK